MKLVVEHDLRQYQCRAECLAVVPVKIFQISMLDNAKTLSLICTSVSRHCKYRISFRDYQVEPPLIIF